MFGAGQETNSLSSLAVCILIWENLLMRGFVTYSSVSSSHDASVQSPPHYQATRSCNGRAVHLHHHGAGSSWRGKWMRLIVHI